MKLAVPILIASCFAVLAGSAFASDIVTVAQGAGLTTLLDLVVKADLAGALTDGSTDLTVLAPTNDAFSKLPAVVLDLLTKPYNKDLLTSVLLYHVFGARILSPTVISLAGSNTPPTLQGSTIAVSVKNSEVFLNTNAKVIQVDVPFTNGAKQGVVHVLNSVLVPPAPFELPTKTITQLGRSSNRLGRLMKTLNQYDNMFTKLLNSFTNEGFTLFAPTNAAFEKLPKRFSRFPLVGRCKRQMAEILRYHVLQSYVRSTDLVDGAKVPTLLGKDITVNLGADVRINDAKVVAADLRAANGIVHLIDEVLIPPGMKIHG